MLSFNEKKYSKILIIKIKSVYVKDFLISTKVRLKRGEHLLGEEPISSEPTFSAKLSFNHYPCIYKFTHNDLIKIRKKHR